MLFVACMLVLILCAMLLLRMMLIAPGERRLAGLELQFRALETSMAEMRTEFRSLRDGVSGVRRVVDQIVNNALEKDGRQ